MANDTTDDIQNAELLKSGDKLPSGMSPADFSTEYIPYPVFDGERIVNQSPVEESKEWIMRRVSFRENVVQKFLDIQKDTDRNLSVMYGSYRSFNPVSKTIYRSGNSLNLALEQQIRGSSDPRWMTLKQANSAGLRVANGAKAATVQYFNFEKVEIEPDPDKVAENEKNGIETEPVYEIRITSQYAYVFNGEDIGGLPAWDAKPPVMAGNNAALLFLEGRQQHLLSNEIIKSYYALRNIPEQHRPLDFSDCIDKIQVQLL